MFVWRTFYGQSYFKSLKVKRTFDTMVPGQRQNIYFKIFDKIIVFVWMAFYGQSYL